jgi:hypothetical protein
MDMDTGLEGHGAVSTDAEAYRLLIPDLITPEQYSDRTRAEATERPEVRIMLAVLADAVATYRRGVACRGGAQNRKPFREVLQWIGSTDDAPLYSFERICATLHFDSAAIREGLERWRERQVPGGAPMKRLAFRRSNERRFIVGSGVRDGKAVRGHERTGDDRASSGKRRVTGHSG